MNDLSDSISFNETLYINTIYPAFEGEGCWVGIPQVFIRFQGCAIGCVNCDSKQTWSYKEHGKRLKLTEVLTEARAFQIPRFSITGGNPLDKKNAPGCVALVKALKQQTCYVNIEATGQEYVEEVFKAVDWISLDIKTPGTQVLPKLEIVEQILKNYGSKTQVKMVCQDLVDLNFIIETYQRLSQKQLIQPYQLLLTPAWENHSSSAQVAQWMDKIFGELQKKPQLKIRVISQNHKWIYGPQREGV